MRKILFGIFVSAFTLVQTAQAVTLNAVDSGVFVPSSASGGVGAITNVSHASSNTAIAFNFSISGFANIDENAFAIFDFLGVTGAVTGASLEMSLSTNNIALGGPGSFVFNPASSDLALFNSSYTERSNWFGMPGDTLGPGRDVYVDLGDGAALGSVSYGGLGPQTAMLGVGGLDLINLGLGGLFAVGINSAGGNVLGGVAFTAPQLTLEVAAVPVPGTVWPFGSTLAGLVGFGNRRKLS